MTDDLNITLDGDDPLSEKRYPEADTPWAVASRALDNYRTLSWDADGVVYDDTGEPTGRIVIPTPGPGTIVAATIWDAAVDGEQIGEWNADEQSIDWA